MPRGKGVLWRGGVVVEVAEEVEEEGRRRGRGKGEPIPQMRRAVGAAALLAPFSAADALQCQRAAAVASSALGARRRLGWLLVLLR